MVSHANRDQPAKRGIPKSFSSLAVAGRKLSAFSVFKNAPKPPVSAVDLEEPISPNLNTKKHRQRNKKLGRHVSEGSSLISMKRRSSPAQPQDKRVTTAVPIIKLTDAEGDQDGPMFKKPMTPAGAGSVPPSKPKRRNAPDSLRSQLSSSGGNEENVSSSYSTSRITVGHAGPTRKRKRISEVIRSTGSASVPSTLPPLDPEDSQAAASAAFQWLIQPKSEANFFKHYWETAPLFIARNHADYYKDLFSTQEFDRILRERDVQFSVNLDVTKYVGGKRSTLNPDGRAYPDIVWKHYNDGASIRFLNPQSFSDSVWKINAALQEKFGTFVGANTYLTPPGTQGFAPHYDDIEAFIVQLEGKKQWKVYAPRNDTERLPRTSSKNFGQDEIGQPLLEVTLAAGDLLYVPRGFIHQAFTVPEAHSLHITISCQQLNTWGDLLAELLPLAVGQALAGEDADFRKSLPVDYMNYMGTCYSSDDSNQERQKFSNKVKGLMKRLIDEAPIDLAVEEMAKKYLHESLPPHLSNDEKRLSIQGGSQQWSDQFRSVSGAAFRPGCSRVKLIRRHCLRITTDDAPDGFIKLYFNTENSRVYKEKDLNSFLIKDSQADIVEDLMFNYPAYSDVDQLTAETVEDKIELLTLLYEKGLLRTEMLLQ